MFFSKLFKRNVSENLSVGDKPATTTKNTTPNRWLENEHNRKASRKGVLGEYKIDIQLDQLPKSFRFLSDLLLPNPKAFSGYSQIDHVVISPYGLFVIETKNYVGEISGGKFDKFWLQNGTYKILNPLRQNYGHIATIKELLKKYNSLQIHSFISFTRRCIFKVDLELRKITSPELIIYDTELSDFINRKVAILSKEHPKGILDASDILDIFKILSDANITDKTIRLEHQKKNGTRKNENHSNDWNQHKFQYVVTLYLKK